jgi:hypothetical protein
MESHGGMVSTGKLVHNSPTAILPAVIWWQAGGMGERNEYLALKSIFVHISK